MSLSNRIAGLLMDMLESSGTTEIQRNELAQTLGCVPSQINYVIASRFTPEQGYIVESRRGVGDAADMQTCRAHILNLHHGGVLDAPNARLMLAALGDNALKAVPAQLRDGVRASIFKQMLLTANGKDDR